MASFPSNFIQSEEGIHPQPHLLQGRFDSWLVERKTSLFNVLAAVSQNKLSVFVARFTVASGGHSSTTFEKISYCLKVSLF